MKKCKANAVMSEKKHLFRQGSAHNRVTLIFLYAVLIKSNKRRHQKSDTSEKCYICKANT